MPYVLGHSCCFILYLTETIKSQIGLLFFHVHLLFFYYSNLHKNKNPEKKVKKIWNASRICVSSLRRGHANLLCIVPILVYVEQVNNEGSPNLPFIPHFSSWPRNHTHRGSFFSKDIPLMTTVFNFWEFFLFIPAQLVKTQLIMTSVFHITRVRKKQTAVTNWLQYVNEDSIWKQNIKAYPWWDSNPQSLN